MLKLTFCDEKEGQASFDLNLDRDIPDIESHFPGLKLIPAYMQLSWLESSLALIDPKKAISEFKAVKFIKKIHPEGFLNIDFDFSNSPNSYKFKISRDNELLTSGSFLTNDLWLCWI